MDLKLYFRIQSKIYGNYFLISGNCMFLLPIIIAWSSILSFSSLFYTKIFVLYWHTVKHQSLYHLTYFEQSTRGVLRRFTVQENNCDRVLFKVQPPAKDLIPLWKKTLSKLFLCEFADIFRNFSKKNYFIHSSACILKSSKAFSLSWKTSLIRHL